MKSRKDHDAEQKHLGEIEERAQGRAHAVRRGGHRNRGTAPGSWRAEGRTQCAGQMDVWECIEEADSD